jgi:cell division septation protein DedD
VAQDDYYYEIQLTNKQLVFYFMAGASGLILSFLAGVMVGRGVEGSALGAVEARPVSEERVVAEQSPAPAAAAAATPAPNDYSYPQRLESDKPEDGLDKKGAKAAAQAPAATHAATPAPAAVHTQTPTPAPAAAHSQSPSLPPVPTPRPAVTTAPAASSTPAPVATPTPAPAPAAAHAAGALPKALPSTASGSYIQLAAFKDKAAADSMVKSLKARGFPAYAVAPAGKSGGLFTVRVGIYRDRADAEAVQSRLNDDKFKPYIRAQ